MNSKHRDIAFFFLAAALTVVISVILKAVSDISQTGVVAGFAGAAALFALGLVALAWPTRTPGAGNGQGRAEVSVTPVTRERGHFKFGDDQAKSAYLEVRNTGNLALADIEVRVVDVLTVEEKQDNPCEHITFNLHEWTPSLVYWSKKEADPPVLRMGIVKDGRRLALVAYSDQPQSQAWAFNTPGVQQVFVSEAKVTIQVSNKSDMLLERDYHIECHPQYPDRTGQRFDFEPWDVWERERPVKKLSGLREWGARIQSRMYHPPPRGGRRFPNEEEIDQFNDDIDHWVKITETCLGGPGALDLITFRNQVGLDSPYDENSDDLLTRQLLTNKNFVARRLTRLNEIIEKKQAALTG